MKTTYLLCFPLALLIASCAQPSLTGDTYQRGQVGQAESIETGRVTSIEPVKIEGGTGAGSLVGALAGGFLGSNIGHGRASNTAGAVGGALVGGAAGSHIEQSMNSRPGIRISVKLDRGGSLAVVQQVNPREEFYVGDRVRVLGSGNSARVTH
jgi:outer membrane lipoprotein SlyB